MIRNGEPDEAKLLHLILGRSDDPECEVCRAHGIPPDAGIFVFEVGSLDPLLGCPCPLCAQIRPESLDR